MSYLQTGVTELLVVSNLGNGTVLENPGSATVQLVNLGNEVVYATVAATPVAAQPITVTSVTAAGLFTCSQTTLSIGQTIVIAGTQDTGVAEVDAGTYTVVGTDGLTTGFYLTDGTPGADTYTPVTPGSFADTSYTFTVPAGTGLVPVIPQVTGDQTLGVPVLPNQPAYITAPGWRSGSLSINAVAATGGDQLLITPVLNVGSQSNVY